MIVNICFNEISKMIKAQIDDVYYTVAKECHYCSITKRTYISAIIISIVIIEDT